MSHPCLRDQPSPPLFSLHQGLIANSILPDWSMLYHMEVVSVYTKSPALSPMSYKRILLKCKCNHQSSSIHVSCLRHAQALAAMKANASWLAQFYLESQSQEQQREQCQRMIVSIAESILPLVQPGVPEKVMHASAHLLLSLLTTVRAPYLMDVPSVQVFYTSAQRIELLNMEVNGLPWLWSNSTNISIPQVQLLVYRSLSHYLLLPCPKRADNLQDWETRAANHASFVAQLMAPLRLLKANSALAQSKDLKEQGLIILNSL